PEGTNNTPATSDLLRKLAAESVVVLKNQNNVLPLRKNKTTAVIGPNAKIATFCGGGSASLLPYYAVSPLEGINKKVTTGVQGVDGCVGYKMISTLGPTSKTPSGKVGVLFRAYLDPPLVVDRTVVDEIDLPEANLFLMNYYELIVDNETVQVAGESFFGMGTVEEKGKLCLVAKKTYEIKVEFGSSGTCKLTTANVEFPGGGLRVGVVKTLGPEMEIEKAIKAAKSVDQVVLSIGLSGDWESEGFDRRHMRLPGNTDALVAAVLDANPNTVVVLQSGTPVEMPWISKTDSIVEAWYGGNETGNGITDVLFGDVNATGKLPLSFPIKVHDNPAYLNYRSERGRTLYGEDIYIGYRYYEAVEKDVLFPFGHGLSYSTFLLSDLTVETDATDGALTVTANVTNISGPSGSEVVQVYIRQCNPSIGRPTKELKAFRKVSLAPGQSKTVKIVMEIKRAISFWDETAKAWISEKDTYDVLVGTSSADIKLSARFETDKTLWWNGL
ncbi:glycosyl hydrolase family 3 C-terminal domain-containing protein, partial [Lipomyces starkeyi]